MEIQDKRTEPATVRFGDIREGDIFAYGPLFYMKLPVVDDYDRNSVTLDGRADVSAFKNDTPIVPVKATLIIEAAK